MKLSEKLTAMILAIIGEAQAIVDNAIKLNRDMNADEAKSVAEKHARVDELKKQKALALKQEAEQAELTALQPRITTDAPVLPNAPTPAVQQQIQRYGIDMLTPPPAEPARYASLKNAPNAKVAYRFGVWVCAVLGMSWAKNKARDMFAPQALSNEGTNTQGGYLVIEEFMNAIIDLREKYGVFRRKCKIVPMKSDRIVIPRRTGGLTAYPVGEGAAGTESTKTWDRVGLTATKWMVLTRMTSEVDEDSIINLGDDLMGEIAYALALAEDTAGFNGDGTSTYAGITGLKNRLDSGAIVTQGTSNTWSTIVLADFHNLMAKIPDYTQAPNPEFYCNKAFFHAVMERLAIATGGATALEVVNGIPQGRFLGYPVNFCTPILNATAVTTITCYFGDLAAAAKFGDRRQITLSTSDQASVGGQSMWERDEIGIKGTERFDIVIHEIGSAVTNRPMAALKVGT